MRQRSKVHEKLLRFLEGNGDTLFLARREVEALVGDLAKDEAMWDECKRFRTVVDKAIAERTPQPTTRRRSLAPAEPDGEG